MNTIQLLGYMTKDPETRTTQNGLKSTVSIIFDDVEILDSQPFAEIIERGQAIAMRIYNYKNG